MGTCLVHHRELYRSFVSHWVHRKCRGCKVGPPQRVGLRTCITNWLHRNEILWVQCWSTTERWNQNLYHTGDTEMTCSGCKDGSPQRIGPSICNTSWLHRHEMQCVQSWSTTGNWIEHLYHCGDTEMKMAVGARLVHHRVLDRAFVSRIGYTEIKCSGCKVGPPQRVGSSVCSTLATPKMQYSGCNVGPPQRIGSSNCITLAAPK